VKAPERGTLKRNVVLPVPALNLAEATFSSGITRSCSAPSPLSSTISIVSPALAESVGFT
jgi:hypothetical protein